MNRDITLYLADDHQIIIDGLKLLISSEGYIKISGWANDGAVAYNEILERKPDLALIDRSMPGMDGLTLIQKLRKVIPETRFIMLTMYDSQSYIRDARAAGASGYLLKNAGKPELRKCLNTVLEGGEYFPDLKKEQRAYTISLFTPREIEIIKLVLAGMTTEKIAEQLFLSKHTVSTHRKYIVGKTKAKNALELKQFLEEHNIHL